MSLNDKTPVKTEKTSQNANFVAQNARKFPGLLKMRSPDAILEIAKHLKTSDAVIEAFDAYAEVVLKSEYELSFKEANRTYVRGRSMLHNYRRIVLALCEIDDDTIFLTTYPAVISKHFFNAENLFSKDDNYGYVTKPGSSVRKAPAGIPIPEISELLSRTRRIVVKRFADWDGVYSVDATSTREFFRRCLELADEHNDTINTIKSILEDLDSVLIA